MIIGNNTLLGTVAGFNASPTKKLYGTGQQTVLDANQRLIAVHVGWAPGNGTASGTVKACLYDQGNVAANKPMIASTEITIPYNAATLGASPTWVSVTGLSVDLSSHAGKTLCPGLAPPAASSSSGFSVLLGTVSGASRDNATVTSSNNPNPFITSATTANQAWSIYFETETIGAATSIDALGSAGTVHVGATEYITTTGLGDLTSALVGGIAPAAIAAPAGDGTLTLADFIDGVVYPAMGTVTTAVSDGSVTASKTDTTLTTKTGWQYVNVTTLATDEFSLGSAFTAPDVPTQLHVINDGTGVLNADGTLTNWAVGTYTCWARMNAGTYAVGTMKSFTFTAHAPVDTAGSDLNLVTAFTSPAITQNFIISPNSFSLSLAFSSPNLSQSTVVSPNNFNVAVQVSEPELVAAGYLQVDNLVLLSLFNNPAVMPSANIVVHDLTSVCSLSIPIVGDLPAGPIYSDRIVQIIGTKIIVQILK